MFSEKIQGRRALLALLALVLAGSLLTVWPSPAEAATGFTVNRTGDAGDRNLADTMCDAAPKEGKQCTLRAAIQEANDTPNSVGPDLINFNIRDTTSVKTINVGSTGLGALPTITEAVTIDGYTQGSKTATTSDDAKPNSLAAGNNAVLKVRLNGTSAGSANGLLIQASESTIKGLVINRFGLDGIQISGAGAQNNKVEGNFIGTDASGTKAAPNAGQGVRITGPSNTLGGTEPGARNLISGNALNGILISASGNRVEGNFIGTNKGGTQALGNAHGVVMTTGASNTLGGTEPGARNVISGNRSIGVYLLSNTSSNNVEGNFIGTGVDGSANVGNSGSGVNIEAANNNTIGGTEPGAGNVIANNGGHGVSIVATFFPTVATAGNRVLSNSTFSNGGLGINLSGGTQDSFGVTANDEDDPDTGANNLQNFPVITEVTSAAGTTTISGTLNSTANQNFTIQCYLTETGGDPSGHGEGQILLGSATTTTTDPTSGNYSFSCVVPLQTAGQVSATATNTTSGDTSEFSAAMGV